MKILVIGAGGTGSYLIPLLQRHLSKEDEIVVVDGDKFEEKNLDRQLFNKRFIGVNKAVTMGLMYNSDNFAKITPVSSFLSDSNMKTYTDAADIDAIVACPDNHPARLRAIQMADIMVVPAILCGNEVECASAMVYLTKYKGTKADPRVVYPDMLSGSDHDPTHACTGIAQEENKQLACANYMAAGFGMSLLYKYVINPVEDKYREGLPFELAWTMWGTEESKSIKQKLEGK